MTYSIVAFDRASGAFGVGVATKHLAVGALVPHARAGIGAVATQASTNPLYGPRGLKLLEEGLSAAEVVARLVAEDEGRDYRQVHVVDRLGRTAGWTGNQTLSFAGHLCADEFSVAGNILAGADVLSGMADAWRANEGLDMPTRILRALEGGDAAGGDSRGRQSAAIYVVGTEDYPLCDFRVDHHPEPIEALREILLEAEQDYYRSFRAQLPVRGLAPIR